MSLVIYHHPCPDGMAAAWVFHRYVPDAKFHGANHGSSPPLEQAEGKIVYLADFCYAYKELRALAAVAREILVLDHHATTYDLVPKFQSTNVRFVLSKEFSGCQLAWNLFAPIYETMHPPWFITDVADRDLFRWAIPGSKDALAALDALGAFASIERLDYVIKSEKRDDLVTIGAFLRRCADTRVADLVKKAERRTLVCPDGKHYPVAYVFCDAADASDVGDVLCKKTDDEGKQLYQMAVLPRYDPKDDCFRVSFRSVGDMDVLPIVSQFQGGGHRNSAGCIFLTRATLEAVLLRPVKV